MNQEDNQKEEKDFLTREEVKTMQKDISGLRETEARRERERVAKIKTEEEIIREKERQILAEKAAQERDLAEKEAKEKEERIKKMRETRETEENAQIQINNEKTESITGGFREALRETQTKEEETRKRFLDRITRQAGEDSPVPPTLPVIEEEKIPEVAKTFVKKPGSGQKVWIRIVLSLFIVSILAGAATFWYFYIRKAPAPEITNPVNSTPEQKELIIPPSLFYIENSQTLKFSQPSEVPFLVFQALQSKIATSSINRILIEDTENTEILGLKGFFDSFNIAPPDGFYEKLANDPTLFVYSQEEGNRLGLAVKINNPEGLAEMMTSWEGTMESNFQGLFELLNKSEPALYSYFRDAQYQGTSFRFQTFSRQDIGIVYTIFDDYFILTTSWKSMEKTLDRLKETPLSLEKMSLAEKIGQLFFIGINGTTLTPDTEKLIANIQPGGVLLLKKNIVNEEQTRKLVQDLQQVSLKSNGIPLFIGVDQEGGEISPVSFVKEKTAQSEIKTTEQAYAVGLNRGEELKDLGVNLNLAPVLDIAQPGDFIFSRAFQTTTSWSSALAKALISGQKASILTAIKHFPGYGDISFDPEQKLATLVETPQVGLFESAAEAKPEFVMTSNVIYSEIDAELPFSFSEKGINMLKESIGRDALIMTDDLPQQSLIDKFSLKGVVTLPIKAGADILTFSTNWETTLPEAVRILNEAIQQGEIAQGQINNSVLKIIKLKKAYYNYE